MRGRLFLPLFALLLVSGFYALADDEPFYELYNDGIVASNSEITVDDMQPTKDQNGIGLCYAFEATALIEQFYCKEMKGTDDACDKSDKRLSPLYLSQLDLVHEGKISNDGGLDGVILTNVSLAREAVLEKCAPFPAMKEFLSGQNNRKLTRITQGKEGSWTFHYDSLGFEHRRAEYDSFRKSEKTDCEECFVKDRFIKDVVQALPEIELEKIKRLIQENDFEGFLFKAFVEERCKDTPKLKIPPFKMQTVYGNHTKEQLLKKIIEVLKTNTPVGFSFETRKPKGHAVAIVGYRMECNSRGEACEPMFKVHNSYGEDWQASHNGGWVKANALFAHKMGTGFERALYWLEKGEASRAPTAPSGAAKLIPKVIYDKERANKNISPPVTPEVPVAPEKPKKNPAPTVIVPAPVRPVPAASSAQAKCIAALKNKNIASEDATMFMCCDENGEKRLIQMPSLTPIDLRRCKPW